MSFSLSSLLNPSPDADSTKQPTPTDQRRESLPSISHIQSPDQQQGTIPQYTPPGQHHPSSPSSTDEHRALAKFANSTAPPPTTWNGYSAANPATDTRRPSSGYDGGLELPPPPPASAQRKMSSPTLDQYHVSSRSPEQQRRTSVMSQSNAAMTLPPLQHVSSHGEEQVQRQSVVSGRPASSGAPSHVPDLGRAESGSQAHAPGSDVEDKFAGQKTSHAIHISTAASHPDPRESDPSPALIKEEATLTPRASSPTDTRRLSAQPADMDGSTLKTVSSLKQEHSMRNGSPLRESSVPMPSTEDASNEASVSKKRRAPKKKGTATTTKKSNPSKKRKLETARGDSPASRLSKSNLKPPSSKGTPAGSSPAPSNRSYSAEPHPSDDEEEEEEEGSPVSDDLYCLCRRPDTGTFMIGCDGTCDDWFHGKCVGIEERDKNLIDKYMCPNCSAAGIGRTTWKRICRRPGCRLPARVGKSKNGKEGSKYCSDECGVAFFREMTSAARRGDHAAKNRASRRKSGYVPASDVTTSSTSDLGARGGVLAAGEVRALLDQSNSLDDFKKLGEGVLSPPATPDSKSATPTNNGAKGVPTYTDAERAAVHSITARKEALRARHQLLKDRLKFVHLARQAAQRAVTERELKPKEYCGFDSRMEWGEEEFAAWRASEVGRQAFELETLAIENSGEGDADRMDEDEDEGGREGGRVCERKRCARHLDWIKLATDDVRFEMGGNGDAMRALDREERAIGERALLRGRAGGLQGEGEVVVHELPEKELGGEVVAQSAEEMQDAPVEVGDAMEVDAAA